MVRAGAHDAVLELLRGETNDPSANLLGAIRDGTAAAVKALVSAGQLRPVPNSAPGASAPEGETKP
jgi:hypothetical protein